MEKVTVEQAKNCERAKKNKWIYNVSEMRYCLEVCKYNVKGTCMKGWVE